MQTKTPLGSLTVICGSMFSGKTEELIRLVRRAMHARKRVQVFKIVAGNPLRYDRYQNARRNVLQCVAAPDSRAMEALIEPGCSGCRN